GPDIELVAIRFHHLDNRLLVGGRVGAEAPDRDLMIAQMPERSLEGGLLGVFGRAVSISSFNVNRHIVNRCNTRLVAIAFFIRFGRIPLFGGNHLIVIVQGVAPLGAKLAGSRRAPTSRSPKGSLMLN